MVDTISSYNFWREYGHPYLPQRKSSHRVEGEVTTCNQSIRDFLLLLICRCSALSYCQFWMCWLWNFKLGFIIFFCHVLANWHQENSGVQIEKRDKVPFTIFLENSMGHLPNLLESTLCHQIFVYWVRDLKFWLQLRFLEPVKMVGSDFT